MNHRIISPPAYLRDHVQYFWVAEVTAFQPQEGTLSTFVDDSTGIILLSGSQQPLQYNEVQLPQAFAYGPATKPTNTTVHRSFSALGVLFYPHALKELFSIDAHEMTNQIVPLDVLLSHEWVAQLSITQQPLTQVEVLSKFIAHRISQVARTDDLIKHCVGHIKSLQGKLTVQDLRHHTKLSERQLERRFQKLIGVSPRHYLKLTRFQEALTLLRERSDLNPIDIAYLLDYADQSHFNRHIRQLSGLSPHQLRQRLLGAPVNVLP